MGLALQFVPLALVLLLTGWAGWYLALRARHEARASLNQPAGIGGWLILVALGQTLIPVGLALQVGLALPDRWELWASHPVAIAVLTAFDIALLGFSLWCSVAFFRTKKAFPTLFIWEAWLLAFRPLATLAWVALAEEGPLEPRIGDDVMAVAIRGTLIAAVWTLYMLRSVRVRNTFVR